jgi:hypothetical protein
MIITKKKINILNKKKSNNILNKDFIYYINKLAKNK